MVLNSGLVSQVMIVTFTVKDQEIEPGNFSRANSAGDYGVSTIIILISDSRFIYDFRAR